MENTQSIEETNGELPVSQHAVFMQQTAATALFAAPVTTPPIVEDDTEEVAEDLTRLDQFDKERRANAQRVAELEDAKYRTRQSTINGMAEMLKTGLSRRSRQLACEELLRKKISLLAEEVGERDNRVLPSEQGIRTTVVAQNKMERLLGKAETPFTHEISFTVNIGGEKLTLRGSQMESTTMADIMGEVATLLRRAAEKEPINLHLRGNGYSSDDFNAAQTLLAK